MMKEITFEHFIMRAPCCYDRATMKKLLKKNFPKLKATPLEIAKCSHPKKEDLLWVLLHPRIIPEKQLWTLACDFVENALLYIKNDKKLNKRWSDEIPNNKDELDKLFHEAIKVRREWINEETNFENIRKARKALDDIFYKPYEHFWPTPAKKKLINFVYNNITVGGMNQAGVKALGSAYDAREILYSKEDRENIGIKRQECLWQLEQVIKTLEKIYCG